MNPGLKSFFLIDWDFEVSRYPAIQIEDTPDATTITYSSEF